MKTWEITLSDGRTVQQDGVQMVVDSIGALLIIDGKGGERCRVRLQPDRLDQLHSPGTEYQHPAAEGGGTPPRPSQADMSVDIERGAWSTTTRSSTGKSESRAVAEPTIRLVFICLAWHANQQGIAWPALSTLAAETGVDERTVRAAIDKLIERDKLELVRRGGKHQGASHYRILSNSTGQQCPPETASQPGTGAHLRTGVNRAIRPSQPGSPASQPGNSAHQTPKNANSRTPVSTPTYLRDTARETAPTSGRQDPVPAHLADLRSRGVANPVEFAQFDPLVVDRVVKQWEANPTDSAGGLVHRLREVAARRGSAPSLTPQGIRPLTAREERTARRLELLAIAGLTPEPPISSTLLQLTAGG